MHEGSATNLLKFEGAVKKRSLRPPSRSRNEVPARPLGRPPAHWSNRSAMVNAEMTTELKAIWREVSKMAPWLTSADRHTVEGICVLRQRARDGRIQCRERRTLHLLMTASGLNPAGRVRQSH
jgi:hypothetical protein